MNFDELGLSPKVLEAVRASGYETPTPIQAQAIPHALEGRDVLGIAQTGTGKTAAFTLPMLSRLEQGRARARMPRTLILEPTRELAAQVEEAFGKYGVNHKLNLALLIGGVSFGDQEAKITRGADVLIATPGRLLDFADRGKILLTGIEILVIDEADRMLDMGFIPDIERICKLVPFTRQTLFFSATMPPEITRLTQQFLQNPVRIEVSRPASTNASIAQTLVKSGVSPEEKRATLRRVIRSADNFKNAIIFCNRKRDVQVVYRSLEKHGFSVGALHGDMDQRARMAALEGFRNNEVQLLVCSDVAARGLDIPDVSHVVNYDAPHHAEDYVHRIGRTGRAGKTGVAVTLATRLDARSVEDIEKLIGQKIDWAPGAEAEVETEAAPERGRRRDGERPARRDRERPARGEAAEPRREAAEPRRERPEGRHERPDSRRGRRPEPAPPAAAAAAPRRSREDYDDAPVVGLGDHVPSFLLRPTRPPRRRGLMFTGIVTDVGRVADFNRRGQLARLVIDARYDAATIAIGASVSNSGVCLTVVERSARPEGVRLAFDVGAETLALTTLGELREGAGINLETSLKIGDELGGHLVSGHADGLAEIVSREDFDDQAKFRFRAPRALARFIAAKGSVALDGTSLTVNAVEGDDFETLLIPHTLAVTTWGERRVGDRVNLEVDRMARYAARLAGLD